MSKLKKFISVMCAALLLVGSMMVNVSATTAELKDTDDIFTLNNSAVKNADNELVITDNYDDLDLSLIHIYKSKHTISYVIVTEYK